MNLKPLDLKLLGIRFQTQPSYNRWIHVITVGQREQFYKDHEKMCQVSVYMVQSERFSADDSVLGSSHRQHII